MDLMTLNDAGQGARLLENWDSLIWAERWRRCGDFVLTTGAVDEFMELMPEGQVVSLRESWVPMITESHLIERKKNKGEVLTIRGRSFDCIFDRRVALNPASAEWRVVAKSSGDAVYYIIRQICELGIVDPADIFPSSKVQFYPPSNYNNPALPNRAYVIARGSLLAAIHGLLDLETKDAPAYGLRAMRTLGGGGPYVIQPYAGRDLSATIRYDGSRDLLDDGRYFFSKSASPNVAMVDGGGTVVKVHQGEQAPTGFDRRVTLVQANQNAGSTTEALLEQGSQALAATSQTALFDGSINEDLNPYRYGVDLDLGDIVNLVGDYGLQTKARMTEFIRSQDAKGSRAYPTFSAVL